MLLRDFTCAACGAPRKTTSSALVVLCQHCGAILTFAGDGLWQPTALAERHESGIAQLVKPTAAQARLQTVNLEMMKLLAPEHRDAWRLLVEEQTVLMEIVYPTQGVPIPAEPDARRRHIANAVMMSELVMFDPEVSRAMRAYASSADLTKGEPVAIARTMLEKARAYYRALDRRMPAGAMREGVEHLSRELVRSAISGYGSLLGDRAIERIRVEVLGVKAGMASCPKCGGPLDGSGLEICRHCGAVTKLDTEDAWTTSQLAIWEISKKDLLRRNQLDGPTPTITAVGGFIHTSAREVPPEKAFAFLRRAIPWVSVQDVMQGLDLLVPAVTDEPKHLLDQLRQLVATRWMPDASQRPAAHIARTEHPAPTPADEEAWIQSALGLWNFQRGNLQVLLSHPLNGMVVATVHEQASGITPRAAMRFFDLAWPGFPRAEMSDYLSRMALAFDQPRMKAFTGELLMLLQGAS